MVRETLRRCDRETLLSAVESIQGAFAIFDVGDRLVLCNSTYRHMFGRKLPGDIVGQAFEELLDGAVAANLFDLGSTTAAEFRSRFIENHRVPSSAIDVRGSDGRSFRIIERRTAEGGTVMTIWDVTEDVEHEEELRSARAAARPPGWSCSGASAACNRTSMRPDCSCTSTLSPSGGEAIATLA